MKDFDKIKLVGQNQVYKKINIQAYIFWHDVCFFLFIHVHTGVKSL